MDLGPSIQGPPNIQSLLSDGFVIDKLKSSGLYCKNIECKSCMRTVGTEISDIGMFMVAKDQVSDNNNYMGMIPAIRAANPRDLSKPVSEIFLPVNGTKVSLSDYLSNLKLYSGDKTDGKNDINLLCKQKDNNIKFSKQISFVPAMSYPHIDYTMRLSNYKLPIMNDPAFLIITASKDGTSCQIIESTNQSLLFNDHGRARWLRLIPEKKDTGELKENELQIILVITVPLKQKGRSLYPSDIKQDTKHEDIKVSESPKNENNFVYEGEFTGTKNLKFERDPKLPITCLIQYYKFHTDYFFIKPEELEIASQVLFSTDIPDM